MTRIMFQSFEGAVAPTLILRNRFTGEMVLTIPAEEIAPGLYKTSDVPITADIYLTYATDAGEVVWTDVVFVESSSGTFYVDGLESIKSGVAEAIAANPTIGILNLLQFDVNDFIKVSLHAVGGDDSYVDRFQTFLDYGTNPANGDPLEVRVISMAQNVITGDQIANGTLSSSKFTAGALNGKGDWTTAASLTPILDALTAVQQSITNQTNLSAKANIFGSPLLEVPDAGNAVYEYRLVVKDDEDKLVNLDAIPSLTLTSSSGTDRSAYLGAVTNPSTGEYVWQLTIAFNSPKESLLLKATGAKGAELRAAIISCQVVDYDTSTILSQILSRIGVPTTTIAGDISALATSVTEVGVDVDSALSEIALTKAAAISASASASSAAAASATASAQATSTNSIMVSMTETVAGPITRFKASALTQVPNSEGGALQDTLLEVQTKVDGLYEGLYPTDPGTPPTVISPSVGEFVTGYGTVFRDGTPVAGERVNIECVAVATESSGMITVGLTMHEISAVNGVVQFSGLPKGATFYIWTGVGRRSSTARQFTIPIDADGTYEFPSVAGS